MTAKESLETIVDLTAIAAVDERTYRYWNPDRYGEPFGVVKIPAAHKSLLHKDLDLTSI